MIDVSTYSASERKSCVGCAYDLGGGQCSASLEDECAAGGFEAWEPRTVFATALEASIYHDAYMRGSCFRAHKTGFGYEAEWE